MTKLEIIQQIRSFENYQEVADREEVSIRVQTDEIDLVFLLETLKEEHGIVDYVEEAPEAAIVETPIPTEKELEEMYEDHFKQIISGLREVRSDYKYEESDTRKVFAWIKREKKTRKVHVLQILVDKRGEYIVEYQGKQAYRGEQYGRNRPYRIRKHREPLSSFLKFIVQESLSDTQ
jgi:hypothetical protein